MLQRLNMALELDLADIQGNILTGYGKLGFPKGRFILLHVDSREQGRKFVTAVLPMITTALRWPSLRAKIPTGRIEVVRPEVAVNIAFTWYGLLALGVPTRSLRGMPDEFIDGMKGRAPMLGDDFGGENWRGAWDEVWTKAGGDYGANPHTVHILITLNAQINPDGTAVAALDVRTRTIAELCQRLGGVRILDGHNRAGEAPRQFQELSAIMAPDTAGRLTPQPKEHFGFTDAIGDPVFEGQYPHGTAIAAIGAGAVDGTGKWRPLATGEFLLGYPDEAQEIAGAAMPRSFSRNGTFFAYRKLRENVAAFSDFLTKTAPRFGAVFGIADPRDAIETLKAKMAGRWSDGAPLSVAPTAPDWRRFNEAYPPESKAREAAMANFAFADDPDGVKCPVTSHIRRVNTRDGMDPTGLNADLAKRNGSVLNNRRRILRRGLPYGGASAGEAESEERGIVMLCVCASLFRQFEFVQQQWINYGLDARAGNDTCPIVGNHAAGGAQTSKFVIPADPKSGRPPFIADGVPQFVETRGGDYFFAPSMTALRMIGMGVVDPT
jgi:Dyp-type peroxidase family